MMKKIMTPRALDRLKKIHGLSKKYNGPAQKKHSKKLLDLLKNHAKEIESLYLGSDPHYLTETGDLAVLCLEILIDNKRSIDETMGHCFDRYERKLKLLLKEGEHEAR